MSWARPRVKSSHWTPAFDDAFSVAISEGDSDKAWQLWLSCAFGLDGSESPFSQAKCSVLRLDRDEVYSIMDLLRQQCVAASAEGWNHERHCLHEETQARLHKALADRRREALSKWKVRMREVALASRWVKQGPSKPLQLCQSDGSLAITPSEQGEAIRSAIGLKRTRKGSKPRSKLLRSSAATCGPVPPRSLLLPLGPSLTSKARFVNRPRVWMNSPSPSSVRCMTSTCIDWPSSSLPLIRACGFRLHGPTLASCVLQRTTAALDPSQSWLWPTACGLPERPAYSANGARGSRLNSWVGGRAHAPPAVDTGNEVAASLAVAYADQLPLAGACLDTIKCFDSVSLHSLRVLLDGVGAPDFLFRVSDLWASLKRHVWTIDGLTGVNIHAGNQKTLGVWALNLVMATWLRTPTLT